MMPNKHLQRTVIRRCGVVTLSFEGVTDWRLDALREQNVLDRLELADAIDSKGQACVGVTVDACYGASGELKCDSASVAAVETIDASSA